MHYTATFLDPTRKKLKFIPDDKSAKGYLADLDSIILVSPIEIHFNTDNCPTMHSVSFITKTVQKFKIA